jgi:hypothetical protein
VTGVCRPRPPPRVDIRAHRTHHQASMPSNRHQHSLTSRHSQQSRAVRAVHPGPVRNPLAAIPPTPAGQRLQLPTSTTSFTKDRKRSGTIDCNAVQGTRRGSGRPTNRAALPHTQKLLLLRHAEARPRPFWTRAPAHKQARALRCWILGAMWQSVGRRVPALVPRPELLCGQRELEGGFARDLRVVLRGGWT